MARKIYKFLALSLLILCFSRTGAALAIGSTSELEGSWVVKRAGQRRRPAMKLALCSEFGVLFGKIKQKRLLLGSSKVLVIERSLFENDTVFTELKSRNNLDFSMAIDLIDADTLEISFDENNTYTARKINNKRSRSCERLVNQALREADDIVFETQ